MFMGSPEEVLSPLRQLISHCQLGQDQLLGIISQPPRPAGRKNILTDPPVAAFAKAMGLPVWQPEKASSSEFLATLQALAPDIIITAAYGQILSDAFLRIPKRATINIHPSKLPAYRGATPVPAALLDGLEVTAISILFTVKALDAGNIILQEPCAIHPEETAGALTERLFAASGPLLLEALELLRHPDFIGQPQNAEHLSICKKINKLDGKIAWGQAVDKIILSFRAYQPWPGSYCQWGEQRIVIEALTKAEEGMQDLAPGAFLFDSKLSALLVGTGTRPVIVSRLKPAGSRSIDARAFWNGAKISGLGSFS